MTEEEKSVFIVLGTLGTFCLTMIALINTGIILN
jgi:hypothetical protein